MLGFNQENKKIVIDPLTIQSIESLRTYYEKNCNKNEKKMINMFTFIHLVAQVDDEAPFYTANYNEIWDIAAHNCFGHTYDSFKPEEKTKIEAMIKDYIEAFETIDSKVSRVFKRKIDEISIILDETKIKIEENFNEKTGGVTFTSNFTIIKGLMKEYSAINEEYEKLKEKIKRESGSVWGGRAPSRLEKKDR